MPLNIRKIAKKNRTITSLYRSVTFHSDTSVKDYLNAQKRKLISTVRPYTMMKWKELSQVYDGVSQLRQDGIPGSMVECGVCNGGSAGVIASLAHPDKDRHIWLFDSWEGLPEATTDDVTYTGEQGEKGMALGSQQRVEELLFDRLSLDKQRIHLVKGWFENTIPPRARDIGTIALLHIDCDWYDSVKLCLDQLFDQVAPGGYIFIDDYGYWQGCTKAVDEFLEQRKLPLPIHKVDASAVYIRKTA